MAPQAAAARAAAYFQLVALFCSATSVAQAFEYVSRVLSWQAAAASAAALLVGSSCKHFLGHTFDSCWIFSGIILLVLWELTEVNSSMIGTGKTRKCEELKGFRDFSILQASIQEEAVENAGSMCFDGHADSKGKDRHDTDGSLSLRLGDASGRVDVPNSVKQLFLVDEANRSSQSVVVNQNLRVVKTIFKGLDGHTTTHRVSEDTMIW